MSEENNTAAAASPAAGGGTSKIVIIASIVNVIATLGIVALLFLSHQKEKNKESVEDIVKGAEAGKAEHTKADAHGAPAEGGHGAPAGDGHGGGAGTAAHGAPDTGQIMHLDPFTVNLITGIGASPRYVRMNVSIELEKDADAKEFEAKTPKVRDIIISLLNSKKANDLNETTGRDQLKETIKSSVNAFMKNAKLKDVYFTNFAISQ